MRKIFYLSLISFLFIGCGNIVENLQKGKIKDSTEIAQQMTKKEVNKKYEGMDEISHYPLIVALKKGNLEIAKILIKKGADVNIKETGEYPLTLSLKNHQYDIAKLLIQKGANVNISNYQGMSPLDIALLNDMDADKAPDFMVKLLIQKNAKLKNVEDIIKTAVKVGEKSNLDFITLILNHFPQYKDILVKYLYQSNDKELYKFAISKKLFSYNQVFSSLKKHHSLKSIICSNYSKNKIFELALKNEDATIIKMCLRNKILLKESVFDLLEKKYNDKEMLKLVYTNYPNLRNHMLLYAVSKSDKRLVNFLFKNNFKISKKLLSKINSMNLDYDTLILIIKNTKHLKNTHSYKLLAKKLKKAKVKKEWEKFIKLSNNDQLSTSKYLNKAGALLKKLSAQNIDKNIKKRANNMRRFLDKFVSEMNSKNGVKRLRKILLYKSFIINETMFLKSGPCLFGMCAGHNQATAKLNVMLMKVLNDTYGKFEIRDVSIHRDSVSSWDAYNKVVNDLRRKYEVGRTITKSIADAMNEAMWKIHTTGNRSGYSKKDLAFIGIYMSDAKAVPNTRDTGNWLVFDNISCDAGILINRLENLQIHNDVFNESYKKMYKKCGWDKIENK